MEELGFCEQETLLKLGTLPALPGLCHVPGALELKQTCPHLGCIPSCRPTP